MKIQYLAVIFILIIMPISIVFSEYVNNQITSIQTENSYDAKLLNATYDAIKAYQLNTVNNATSDRPESKIDDIEAAVTTFYNSLITSFGYDGYQTSVMDSYVPAVVFCLYDGYYIYSPFYNTLTEMTDDEVDKDYADGELLNGLKPYVYYNKSYSGTNSNGDSYDIVITYTLDNFITIDGTIGDDAVYESGYLVDGIIKRTTEDGDTYEYDGVTFSENTTEELKELVGSKMYSYTKIDGTKFYYSEAGDVSTNECIFYLDSSGDIKIQVENDENNGDRFAIYYEAITNNIDAYVYYRDAYEFTEKVREEYGLKNLTNDDGLKIFDENISEYYIQDSNSNFNEERMQVIKDVIKTNLVTAISAYGEYGDSSVEYIMPEISETDWDLITNNVCIATFMQGMSIGSKVYNSYAVVANNLTKEYVDENDIYITTSDHTYSKANDTNLVTSYSVSELENGILKLNFERRRYELDGTYYYPISYQDSSVTTGFSAYLGSYTSIIGSSSLYDISTIDMYRYMREKVKDVSGADSDAVTKLKTLYYTALGRERVQSYNVQNGLNDDNTGTVTNPTSGNSIDVENWYYLINYDTVSSSAIVSEGDIYYIEDLIEFANDGNTYSGETVTLARSLDFNSEDSWRYPETNMGVLEYTPKAEFEGTFDGQGYTISNMPIDDTQEFSITLYSSSETGLASGLFAYTSGATIQNLTLSNVTINISESSAIDSTPYCAAGGFVGYAVNTTISNCNIIGSSSEITVDVVVSTLNETESLTQEYAEAGGIAGYIYGGTITDCSSSGDVSVISENMQSHAGGIVGVSRGTTTVDNCTNTGKISSQTTNYAHAGGISGVASSNTTISNSHNSALIKATGTYNKDAQAGRHSGLDI